MNNFKDLLSIILDLKYSKYIKKKSNICIYNNCNKQASFNYKNKSKALYCKNHKLTNMIDIISKKCIICNDKIPNFNYKNEKIALYCANCKLTDMIDIKNKKCIKCKIKQPTFNYKNESKALYCNNCKLSNMIDIRHKKCVTCNIKNPLYNYKNEKIALYCIDCKLENMKDIYNKKCITCNNKRASFNYKNESKALYCNSCKLENMINIKSKKCITCKIKIPIFNYKNELKALYYNDCKLENMIDIIHKKCKLCNLIFTSKKYDYLCSGCYYYTNPDSVLTRNHKTKENHIISDLNKEFNNIIIHDRIIINGCSKRRPDGLIQLNDYNIIIEIDENQHNNYECENKRLMEIFKDLGNSPLTIIRFNPDSYKIGNKKIKSPFGITKIDGKLKIINQKEYNIRLTKLIEVVKENLNIIPDKEINIINLFYNLI
jgi:uncharacterized protein YajQ (UPF0234 family)